MHHTPVAFKNVILENEMYIEGKTDGIFSTFYCSPKITIFLGRQKKSKTVSTLTKLKIKPKRYQHYETDNKSSTIRKKDAISQRVQRKNIQQKAP